MKKLLIMGMFLGLFYSNNANATVITDKIEGAFDADEAVQDATAQLKRQLRVALPNCTLRVVPELEGHFFASGVARNNLNGVTRHTKTYLVSRHVTCSLVANNMTRGMRRSVTAKVQVNVKKLPGGEVDESPQRVILVDISNAEDVE